MVRANKRTGVEEINISGTACLKRLIRNVVKLDIMINSFIILPFRLCVLLIKLIIQFVRSLLCPFYFCCFLVGRVFERQA